MEHFLMLVLVALSIHRLWLYEDIFMKPRLWVSRRPWLKPLYCPACFAFWAGVIALGCIPLLQYSWAPYIILPIAAYAPLRAAVGLQTGLRRFFKMNSVGLVNALNEAGVLGTAPSATKPKKAEDPVTYARDEIGKQEDGSMNTIPSKGPGATIVSISDAECADCERNSKIMAQPPKEYPVSDVKRIVHLTALRAFSPAYSVSNVVLEHARAAIAKGVYVCVVVNELFDVDSIPEDLKWDNRFMLKAVMPVRAFKEDEVLEDSVDSVTHAIRGALMSMGRGIAFTHDLLFSSYHLTHAKSLHNLASFPAFTIYHVCHSGPGGAAYADSIKYRRRLPEGHKLVCLNYHEVHAFSEYYATDAESIVVLPNHKDAGSFFDLDEEATALAKKADISLADYAQVFPVSMPRHKAKGLHHVVATLHALKDHGLSVRLLVIDSHVNSPEGDKSLAEAKQQVYDLNMREDVFFASDIIGKGAMEKGLSQKQVASLMFYANLFIFPSYAEASPLSVLEAALAGNMLVLNNDLPQLSDIVPHKSAIWFPFGSKYKKANGIDYQKVAEQILYAGTWDKVGSSKRNILQRFSTEALGDRIIDLFN
ncbi:MAG: glycosyltransferase family 4 protein [Okeania sp. SIO3H1]|nr:glycosyltransferase family 4 protein [Okeania sp. SIO3H1]